MIFFDSSHLMNYEATTTPPIVIERSILDDISFCESTNRQFDEEGNVLRGVVNNKDVGLFQINEYYHLEDSKKLGIDIYTEEGNRKYAEYLYHKYGTQPWKASEKCWLNKI